ncbi:unnamed protein product, partial [Discosporangium mesarthrocarpum]
HGLKFQGVVLPNGLLCDWYRPVAWSGHDVYKLSRGNLNPKVANRQEGAPIQLVVHGDTAYPNLSHVKLGYRRTANIQPGQVDSLGPCQWPGSVSSGDLENLHTSSPSYSTKRT